MERKQESLGGNRLIDSPFFKTVARSYLDYLGNSNPTHKQLSEIQSLLLEGSLRQPKNINLRLNQQEKQCLNLSAQGKKLKEIAFQLDVSQKEISRFRQSILQKLGCKTMSSAIIVGIRYGEIKPED